MKRAILGERDPSVKWIAMFSLTFDNVSRKLYDRLKVTQPEERKIALRRELYKYD